MAKPKAVESSGFFKEAGFIRWFGLIGSLLAGLPSFILTLYILADIARSGFDDDGIAALLLAIGIAGIILSLIFISFIILGKKENSKLYKPIFYTTLIYLVLIIIAWFVGFYLFILSSPFVMIGLFIWTLVISYKNKSLNAERMSWKNWSAVKKGALIGLLSGIPTGAVFWYFLLSSVRSRSIRGTGMQIQIYWNEPSFIIAFIIVVILSLSLGALIGYIVQKLKK